MVYAFCADRSERTSFHSYHVIISLIHVWGAPERPHRLELGPHARHDVPAQRRKALHFRVIRVEEIRHLHVQRDARERARAPGQAIGDGGVHDTVPRVRGDAQPFELARDDEDLAAERQALRS